MLEYYSNAKKFNVDILLAGSGSQKKMWILFEKVGEGFSIPAKLFKLTKLEHLFMAHW